MGNDGTRCQPQRLPYRARRLVPYFFGQVLPTTQKSNSIMPTVGCVQLVFMFQVLTPAKKMKGGFIAVHGLKVQLGVRT
jgi:hypothetical protein